MLFETIRTTETHTTITNTSIARETIQSFLPPHYEAGKQTSKLIWIKDIKTKKLLKLSLSQQ